jgi:hypothetical protein
MIEIDFYFRTEGFNRLLFDKRELKAAIRKGGAVVRKEARRLIASRAISAAGEIPGYDSGAMSRSIKVKVGSGGGYAKVMPYMTQQMINNSKSAKYPDGAFYPAFLMVGTRRGLRPRKDFMQAALDNKQSEIRAAITAALANAIRTG